MPKTRVGIFSADFHPCDGGIGMVTLDLYRALLRDSEFEPFVFSPMTNDLENHERITAIRSRTLRPIHFSVKVNALLERLVRRHALDVLHFMGSSGGVQLLRKPQKPALFTLHNTYHYLYRQFHGPVFFTLRQVERCSLRNADQIIPSSEGVRDELPAPNGPKVRVIRNGIDTTLFYPRALPRERFFLFLGRLGERKGVFDLLQAFALADCAGFELWFAGVGPASDEIRATAERLGLASRVRLLGHVPRATIPDLFARAHAVVLPSWSEGFPLTVAEAMACGALFIGSRIPGISEQIANGQNGFLCAVRDPRALAEALSAAAALAPSEIDALRQRAGETARAFSIDAMVERYRDVYRTLLRA